MEIILKKTETEEEMRGKAYVHGKAWQEAYAGLVDPVYLQALTLEKCERVARAWPDGICVAKEGDAVIGFVSFLKCRDEDLAEAGEVAAIYLLSAYYLPFSTSSSRGWGGAALECPLLDRTCGFPWMD